MNKNIFQDWKCNDGNLKGRLVMISYRLAHAIRSHWYFIFLGFPFLIFYRFFIEWMLGIEIHWNAKIGKSMHLAHGQSTVLNGGASIGNYCTLRHCTTIGHKDGMLSKPPVIGDNVNIGANVCIIGNIKIGDNVIIGAGSVVVKDVPSNCTVVGNPAKVLTFSR
ncbi:hypothetical protein LCGC14_0570830 [marine sediment metagenome]|uniref:Serine O-acetyltransferase n=1 Tax=marine sediment metagenome TaxID=412755 RepID=A0A0F9U5J3_9ZZZZ